MKPSPLDLEARAHSEHAHELRLWLRALDISLDAFAKDLDASLTAAELLAEQAGGRRKSRAAR